MGSRVPGSVHDMVLDNSGRLTNLRAVFWSLSVVRDRLQYAPYSLSRNTMKYIALAALLLLGACAKKEAPAPATETPAAPAAADSMARDTAKM